MTKVQWFYWWGLMGLAVASLISGMYPECATFTVGAVVINALAKRPE